MRKNALAQADTVHTQEEGRNIEIMQTLDTAAFWTLTSLRQDPVEDVGEVQLPLSDPSTQVLPVQQVQEETKLTQQLLHRCSRHRHTQTQTQVSDMNTSSFISRKQALIKADWRSALVTPPGDRI